MFGTGRTPAERFHFHRTLLHVAAESGATACVSLLLNRGAEIESIDEAGHTPLIYAVQGRHPKTAAYLLDSGARICYDFTSEDSPEIRGVLRQTHSRIMDQARQAHPEIFALLQSQELDVNQEELKHQLSDLFVDASVRPRKIQAIHHCGDLATLQLLVERYGAVVNVEDGAGYWPLKSFAEAGDIGAVAWLLAHGANPDFTSTGETALHAAVSGNHLECARLLLEAGANPNQQDVDGQVPMWRVDSHDMLDLLLSYRADPSIGDQCGHKPSHWVENPELKARLQTLEHSSRM